MYVQVAKNGNAKKTQPETGCHHQLATHATKRKKKQKEEKKAKIHQSKQKLKTSQRRPPLKPPLKCCTQRNKPDVAASVRKSDRNPPGPASCWVTQWTRPQSCDKRRRRRLHL
mmetsp:Transcript_17389/g.33958  ORF Transcript_17389/g.33958 Transcript_17389/m.33958 type:complete len:113 (+) Transcript_17389:208-546(+)